MAPHCNTSVQKVSYMNLSSRPIRGQNERPTAPSGDMPETNICNATPCVYVCVCACVYVFECECVCVGTRVYVCVATIHLDAEYSKFIVVAQPY